jgi:hypothetical protein
VNANPNPLMSPVVQPSLIGLFIALRNHRPLIVRLLSGSCATYRTFAEKARTSGLATPAG